MSIDCESIHQCDNSLGHILNLVGQKISLAKTVNKLFLYDV